MEKYRGCGRVEYIRSAERRVMEIEKIVEGLRRITIIGFLYLTILVGSLFLEAVLGNPWVTILGVAGGTVFFVPTALFSLLSLYRARHR